MTIEKITQCTGCGACSYFCSQNAIQMMFNDNGFISPQIDSSKCSNCGVCFNKCTTKKAITDKFLRVFYAFSNNSSIQKTSTSGGLFTEIANAFINSDGVVFAAGLDSDLQCKHMEISDCKDIEKVRNSKYIQSSFYFVYERIESLLRNCKKVLVCGTPCQIAGIKNVFNENPYLYTIELVCHGVPSQKLFDSYIKYLEIKNKTKILNFEFRNKKYAGWSCGAASVYTFDKMKKRKIEGVLDPYYSSFLQGISLSDSCFTCSYSKLNRVGDITLGDAWGMEKEYPNVNIKNGANLCICNTQKGEELIKLIEKNISVFPSKYGNIEKTTVVNIDRNEIKQLQENFYNEFRKNNCLFWDNIKVSTKWHALLVFIKRKIFYYMPFGIKKIARRIFK